MQQRLLLFILFVFFCYGWQSFSEEQSNNSLYEIPYEICNWENKEYTKSVIEQARQFKFTEAFSSCTEAYCWDIFRNFMIQEEYNWILKIQDTFLSNYDSANKSSSDRIPDICFYANMLRPVNIRAGAKFYYCETPNSAPKDQMDFLCPGKNKTPCTWQPSGEGEHQLCVSQPEQSNSECIKKIEPKRFCRNKDYV